MNATLGVTKIVEIPYQNPLYVFSAFSQQAGTVFLDSAQMMAGCGRYSFISVDPFLILTSKNGQIQLGDKKFAGNPFDVLAQEMNRFSLETHSNLPPFQGGIAGFFSYDLGQHLEPMSLANIDDMQFPDLAVGFYDLVIGFDCLTERAWVFSSGYPLQEKNARSARAEKRINWVLDQLTNLSKITNSAPLLFSDKSFPATVTHNKTINKDFLIPICNEKAIHSNFTQESYQSAAQKVIQYILAGDIFEANISQRFRVDLSHHLNPFVLYQRLRKINPAPFSAYINLADTIIASASPERFLKLVDRNVETRPIKGTRPRGKNSAEDAAISDMLIKSEKDRAENIMIVDLLRNDLSRVCKDHSVQVPQLCGLESYATVHQLVSVVIGKLREKLTAIDLLRATFPGGSITGAPKVRSMEIIAEIEPTCRGPYCGSAGYIGFNGDMDSSILIRSYSIKNNIVTFQAGGAVVADSNPVSEYEETLTKAKALQKALTDDFTDR